MKRMLALLLLLCLLPLAALSQTAIDFPTAATTGTLYPLCSMLGSLWNAKLPDVRVVVQASGGGVDNLNFLQEGEAEVSVAVSSVAYQSMTGEGVFEGYANPGLRVIAGLYYNPNQIVVTAASGIETLFDIAGKRFAPGAAGSTTLDESEKHLTRAGVAYPDGFTAVYAGFNEAIDLMRNGQLDGAWVMAGIPTAAVTEMATSGGRVISIPEDVIASLMTDYPWYARYVIPAGTYPGQDEDIQTTAVRMLLLTNESMDKDVIYNLTRVLWENVSELSAAFPSMRNITAKDACESLAGIPFHAGAEKWYREQGYIQ